jgi:hypothetical protein
MGIAGVRLRDYDCIVMMFIIRRQYCSWIISLLLLNSCAQQAHQNPPALTPPPQDQPEPAPKPSDETSAEEKVTTFVDTKLVDPRYGSKVRAQISAVNLQNLSTIQLLTKDGADLLSLRRDRPIDVTVVLPEGMDKADEDAFMREVEKSLNRRFDRAVFSVHHSYLPAWVVQSVEQREANAHDYETWKQWTIRIAEEIRDGSYQPEKADLFFGSLIGQARAFGTAGYWIGVSGWNGYGIAQSFLAMALNQFFSLFPTQINTWKAEHEIPIFKDVPLVRFYNSNPLIKTSAINELTALSMQVAFRWLSHFANPAEIASPLSREFLLPFFGMSLVRAPFGAAEDLGVLKLLKKGYISRRTAHYMSNAFGVQSLVTGLLFSAGRMRLVPVAFGLEWSTKMAVWLTSMILPAKDNRLVIIHPKVYGRSLDQVEYTYDLRNLPLNQKNINSADLENLLSAYRFGGPQENPQLTVVTSP